MESLPGYLQIGSLLQVQLSSSLTANTVKIIRAFTPFTMGQVFLVKPKDNPELILKVYDPRFMMSARRIYKEYPKPWSSENEKRACYLRREMPPSNDDVEQPGRDDDDVTWEDYFFQESELMFKSEVESYKRLKSLYGQGVAHFYDHGALSIPEDANEPRFVTPKALLLEYIPESVNLKDIDPSASPSLVVSLIQSATAFGRLGVVHNDVGIHNFLFSPSKNPTRAVIIDFGSSIYREDETDERWALIVQQQGDVLGVKGTIARRMGYKYNSEEFKTFLLWCTGRS